MLPWQIFLIYFTILDKTLYVLPKEWWKQSGQLELFNNIHWHRFILAYISIGSHIDPYTAVQSIPMSPPLGERKVLQSLPSNLPQPNFDDSDSSAASSRLGHEVSGDFDDVASFASENDAGSARKSKPSNRYAQTYTWTEPIFVVRCLDSIIPLVSRSELSSLYLASVAVQAGLCPTWSQTLRTGFLVTRLNLEFVYYCKSPKSLGIQNIVVRILKWAMSCENVSYVICFRAVWSASLLFAA